MDDVTKLARPEKRNKKFCCDTKQVRKTAQPRYPYFETSADSLDEGESSRLTENKREPQPELVSVANRIQDEGRACRRRLAPGGSLNSRMHLVGGYALGDETRSKACIKLPGLT